MSNKDLSKIKSPLDSILSRGVVDEEGEVLPQGSIYEANFGYNAKMEVYTNLSSDIPKLAEMPKILTKKRR